MRYILLIYRDERAMGVAERSGCEQQAVRLAQHLHARGQYLGASPLESVDLATSVRVRDGKKLVTDGPFAETKEQLGGFFLVDVQDLDEAIAIAAQIPPVHVGTVEIRPVMELVGLPTST